MQSSPPRLPVRGRALTIARVLWIAIALFTIVIYLRAIPSRLAEIAGLVHPVVTVLQRLGLPPDFYIIYTVAIEVGTMLVFTITAAVIFWNKSNDWMTIFVSLALLTFGANIFIQMLESLRIALPAWQLPILLLRGLGVGSILIVFYLFPDGRYVPQWTRVLVFGWILYLLIWALATSAPPQNVNQLPAFLQYALNIVTPRPGMLLPVLNYFRLGALLVLMLCWFASGVGSQIYRYLHVSTPIQRLQTKWVVFGFAIGVGLYFISLVMQFFLDPRRVGAMGVMVYGPVTTLLMAVGALLVPFTLAVSMLRYRLWDIDVLINQALVYGVVTTLLGGFYLGSVLLIQYIFQIILQMLSGATTAPSTVTIAIMTLLVVILTQPVRHRVQDLIDRLFYREKVDFRQAFIDFSRQVRMLIDLPELLKVLVERTMELLHIGHGAVFLINPDNQIRLAEASNLPAGVMSLRLDSAQIQQLRSGNAVTTTLDPAFVLFIPLLAPHTGEPPESIPSSSPRETARIFTQRPSAAKKSAATELVGILALGPRRSGLGYSREDRALLLGLADQAGTAIYVARLIAEKQSEADRREEMEHKLAEHRNSPIGRAENLAQQLIAQPASALRQLHQLAQEAGKDLAAANLLANLPSALSSLQTEHGRTLASLAEGYNYLFTGQYTVELLQVGLRTLIAALTMNLGGNPKEDQHRERALAVYVQCQEGLEINSIVQITGSKEFRGNGSEISSPPPPDHFPLAELERALVELEPVTEALRAYERVDTSEDKLAYLASTVDRLRHVDRFARSELGSADRAIIRRLVESWQAIVTGAIGDLQVRAHIVCQLLTRHTWQENIVSLVLSLNNSGRGAAINVRVTLAPDPDYTLFDENALIERLAPGEEAQVQLRVRPRLERGIQQFRARFVILYTDPRGADQVENFADVVKLLTIEGEFHFISNPYVVGTPLKSGSPLFFGREDVITFIQENLAASHRNNLVLIGQRRTGKSSLLKQLPVRLGDEYLPVYLDGQALGLDPGLPNFFLTIATEITFALEDRGFPIPPPEPSDFTGSPASAFEHSFLGRVRQAIGSRHLLLMLDEFEELEAAVHRGDLEPSIFGFLRHIIQHSTDLSVIFCGTHRLEELAADYWNVLFNISLYRHIAFLEKEEAFRLISDPVASFNMRYDDLALDKIWRVTAGHPYFLQLLAHSLVNRHNKTERSYMTVADVNAALDDILASGEAHFVYLWAESSHAERLILTALSRMIPITGHAASVQIVDYLAERGIKLERQAVSEALYHLTLRDVLKTAETGLSETYQWKLGLLSLWVEKYKSMSRVVDENTKRDSP